VGKEPMFLINIDFKPFPLDKDRILPTTIRTYMPRPYGDDTIDKEFNILSHI
jgi:hypothetical protein